MNLRADIGNENCKVAAYVENLFDGTYFTSAYREALPDGLHIKSGVQCQGLCA
ncbi:hypothetical protein NOR51B_2230 [Luminiphilus syltensis NOR5-1B]|uniref:Uncharacterized protein n=1 Tax=Luminiphilus syltensis NOR5-1B TaxID=565045 RepID=B8KS47_9GAMM|nr:hypothetical protein NOR51B_2230 [Luminiphilus syltensis NOR5-1B]